MILIYEKEIKINCEDIDINGHLNNVIFLEMMQNIAIEHSSKNGYTLEKYSELGTSWFAKNHCINYIKPILENDTIVIKTWIEEISRFSAVRKYEFINIKEDASVCTAESTWVYIKQVNGRPCKIDDIIKKAFTPIKL